MPNWITNKIQVAKEDLEKFKELAVNDEGDITFAKALPIPKPLMIESAVFPKNDDTPLREPVEYTTPAGEVRTLTTVKELNAAYEENEEYYNYPTWYEWCTAVWGCKWDASECRRLSECVWCFETPWDAPYGWYEALSELIAFKAIGADEGDLEPAFYFVSKGGGKTSEVTTNAYEGMALGLLMKYGELAKATLEEIAEGYDDKVIKALRKCLKDPGLIKKAAPELEDTDFFR